MLIVYEKSVVTLVALSACLSVITLQQSISKFRHMISDGDAAQLIAEMWGDIVYGWPRGHVGKPAKEVELAS